MKDVYKDMQEDQDRYDNSDYPQNHMFHSNTNKKVIGKSKDERVGEIHQEFIGLRAKIFSFMMDSEKKTAKGVKKNIKDREIFRLSLQQSLSATLHDEFQIRSSLRDTFPVPQTLGREPQFFFAFGYEVFG